MVKFLATNREASCASCKFYIGVNNPFLKKFQRCVREKHQHRYPAEERKTPLPLAVLTNSCGTTGRFYKESGYEQSEKYYTIQDSSPPVVIWSKGLTLGRSADD
jgi:hypothetical protein